MAAAPRVLVFDSGIGGLSIAGCVHTRLPGVQLLYLADNAAFPYGSQPESVVLERTLRLVDQALVQFPCDVVIIACNTASTLVLPTLRKHLSVPVVGVVPAIKPAAQISINRRIGILATPATVSRPYLTRLVEEFAGDCEVVRIGHPELVQWIERQMDGEAIALNNLQELLQPFRSRGVDVVVLGCTHYPLIREQLQSALPEVDHWVDSGDAIARRVQWLLEEHSIATTEPEVQPPAEGVLQMMLFTGEAPQGICAVAGQQGLEVGALLANWPLNQASQLED